LDDADLVVRADAVLAGQVAPVPCRACELRRDATKEEAIEVLREMLESWKKNEHDVDEETCRSIENRFYNDTLENLRRKNAEFVGATHEGNKPSETKTPFVQKFADDLLKNYPEKIEGKDWFRVER